MVMSTQSARPTLRTPGYQGYLLLRTAFVNPLSAEPPEYYDIALRDFGLMIGAQTLNRLAVHFGAPTVAEDVRRLRPAA